MKVLILSQLFPNSKKPTGGIFNLSRAKALRRLGHDVIIIAPIGLTPPERFIFPHPRFNLLLKFVKHQMSIPVHEKIEDFDVYHPKFATLPLRWFWNLEVNLLHLFAGKIILNFFKKFNPDVVITSWLHPFATYSKFIKRKFDIPIISIVDGSDLLVYPKRYKGIETINIAVQRNVDMLVYPSNQAYYSTQDYFKVSNSIVIHNGYERSKFFLNKELIKKNLNNKTNIISVGSLRHVKGYDILLQAFNRLDNNFSLYLRGDGRLKRQYEDLIKTENLNKRVKFIGKSDFNQLRQLLHKKDIYCQPSRSEGFPAAPLEAMACGLPVVCTEVGGMPEFIIEGFNGYLCEPESPESLAEAIIKAKNTDWDHLKIAEWVCKNFSWDHWGGKIDKVITELLINKEIKTEEV